MDLSGDVRARRHEVLSLPAPMEAISRMADMTMESAEAQGLDVEMLSGIGIGFPGPFDIETENGTKRTVTPKAFPDWHRVPVVDMIKARITCPVFLKNNATAAAIGERWYGNGHSRSTFFYLFFGIGLGGGMICDGRPYEGYSGNAGELGYIPTVDCPDANDFTHVGEYFNLAHLYDRLEEQGHSVSQPHHLEPLYEQGNTCVRQWVDEARDHLVRLVLSIEYLLDPETIFFGGRLPDPIIRDIMEGVERKLPPFRTSGKSTAPALEPASAGKDAAALGVATLPLYEFYAPAPSLLIKQQHDGSGTQMPS